MKLVDFDEASSIIEIVTGGDIRVEGDIVFLHEGGEKRHIGFLYPDGTYQCTEERLAVNL